MIFTDEPLILAADPGGLNQRIPRSAVEVNITERVSHTTESNIE
jgi:hypothetical protein